MTFILPKCSGLFEVRFEGFDHFFDSGLLFLPFCKKRGKIRQVRNEYHFS